MKVLSLLCLIFTFASFAQTKKVRINLIRPEIGPTFLQEKIEQESKKHIFVFETNSFARKNFNIFWAVGKKDTTRITKDEYDKLWGTINRVSGLGFQVTLNTQAVNADIKDAIESKSAAVILVSAHGNEDGFYDYNEELVPYTVFQKASKSLYQFILSACDGVEMLPHYNVPKRIKVYAWSKFTDTSELMELLRSPDWDINEGGEE